MGPSHGYDKEHSSSERNASDFESRVQLEDWELQEIFDKVPLHVPNCTQYYVQAV